MEPITTPETEVVTALMQLWRLIMPPSIPTPLGHTFFLWVTSHEVRYIKAAIVQTAKKMARNLYEGRPIPDDGAPKYVSSILGKRKIGGTQ